MHPSQAFASLLDKHTSESGWRRVRAPTGRTAPSQPASSPRERRLSLEPLELRSQPRDLLLRFLAPPLCLFTPPGLLLAEAISLFTAPGLLVGAPLGRIVHRLHARDELLALQQQRRARVEPEPILVDLDVETKHARLVQAVVRNDWGVDTRIGRGQAIRGEPVASAIVEEVLGDP